MKISINTPSKSDAKQKELQDIGQSDDSSYQWMHNSSNNNQQWQNYNNYGPQAQYNYATGYNFGQNNTNNYNQNYGGYGQQGPWGPHSNYSAQNNW